eukprot:gene16272-11699_t
MRPMAAALALAASASAGEFDQWCAAPPAPQSHTPPPPQPDYNAMINSNFGVLMNMNFTLIAAAAPPLAAAAINVMVCVSCVAAAAPLSVNYTGNLVADDL